MVYGLCSQAQRKYTQGWTVKYSQKYRYLKMLNILFTLRDVLCICKLIKYCTVYCKSENLDKLRKYHCGAVGSPLKI